MAISPWPVGQLSPITIPLSQESKTVDLTGQLNSYVSVIVYTVSTTSAGVKTYTLLRTSAGACMITQNKPGIIQWTPTNTDVGTAGAYALRVSVNMGGTTPQIYDYLDWVIQV